MLFWSLEKPPTFISNLNDVTRWLLQDTSIFRSKEVLVDNVDGDSVHLRKLSRELPFHFWVTKSSWLQNAWVLLCWNLLCQKLQMLLVEKKLPDSCRIVRKQTLWKQLGSGSSKKTASRIISTKSAKKTNGRKDKFLQTFLSSNFPYQHFMTVSGNHGGKIPVADNLLSSHETRSLSFYVMWWKLHRIWI